MGMPPAKRFSGRADHLQRASNPAAVRRGKACRAFAVFLLQGEISLCHGKRPDLCSDAGINLRNGRDAVQQRPYIKARSEEHTSELQSLMRISYAVFCLKKKK